jgi:hypothetical protein
MKSFIAILLCTLSLPATAADLDYTYLDIAYVRASNDFTNSVGNGYQLGGSWSLGGSGFSLEGGYQHQRFGSTNISISLVLTPENYRFGGGYHIVLGKSVDFVAHVDYMNAKTTSELDGVFSSGPIIFSQSDHGYLIGAGVRARLSDDFELDAGLGHDNTGFHETTSGSGCGPFGCVIEWRQNGSENVLSGAVRFRVHGPMVLGVEYRHSSLQDGNEWLMSARWEF